MENIEIVSSCQHGCHECKTQRAGLGAKIDHAFSSEPCVLQCMRIINEIHIVILGVQLSNIAVDIFQITFASLEFSIQSVKVSTDSHNF